jgi:hypothetical protein
VSRRLCGREAMQQVCAVHARLQHKATTNTNSLAVQQDRNSAAVLTCWPRACCTPCPPQKYATVQYKGTANSTSWQRSSPHLLATRTLYSLPWW